MHLRTAVFTAVMLALASPALAHFGMLIPNDDVVLDQKNSQLNLTLSFSHPMEGKGMDMAKPQAFGVFTDNQKTDLLPTLQSAKVMEHNAWQGKYSLKRPGVYQFYVIPELYWEPAEDCFIQHITKVYVPAFGEEEGWEAPIGLATEIVPLTRPFGNYAGNIFSGKVLVDGKPAANAAVEVEYYNKGKNYEPPNDYMVTQVVKTNSEGIFSFVVPWPGWWGFAALSEAPQKMKKDGVDKSIEMGAVLWTNFTAPKQTKKK